MGKMNALSCGAQCSRITLITLNIIFLLCGLALTVLGGIFRFGSDQIKDEIKLALDEIKFQDLDFYNLVNSLGIIFMVVGIVVVIFSILGFIGAACYVTWALVLYAILISLCLIAELAGVVLFFLVEEEFEDATIEGMKKSIQKANEGKKDYVDAVTYMFEKLKCCHVDNLYLNANATSTPLASCSRTSDNHSKDCYTEFKDWLREYQYAFIGIGIASIIVQIFLVVFSCCVCRAARKEELV